MTSYWTTILIITRPGRSESCDGQEIIWFHLFLSVSIYFHLFLCIVICYNLFPSVLFLSDFYRFISVSFCFYLLPSVSTCFYQFLSAHDHQNWHDYPHHHQTREVRKPRWPGRSSGSICFFHNQCNYPHHHQLTRRGKSGSHDDQWDHLVPSGHADIATAWVRPTCIVGKKWEPCSHLFSCQKSEKCSKSDICWIDVATKKKAKNGTSGFTKLRDFLNGIWKNTPENSGSQKKNQVVQLCLPDHWVFLWSLLISSPDDLIYLVTRTLLLHGCALPDHRVFLYPAISICHSLYRLQALIIAHCPPDECIHIRKKTCDHFTFWIL